METNFNILDGIGDTGVNPQWSLNEGGFIEC